MPVDEFYEEMYRDRGRPAPQLPYLYRKLRRFQVNRTEMAKDLAPGGGSALDIGCGDGDLLVGLKAKYEQVWGIDIAESRINRINERYGTNCSIHARSGDANQRVDFEDNSFDTILAISVLEHLFDPHHFMREARRLLRMGGTLIVQVPNVAFLPNRIRLLLGKQPITSEEAGWDGGHLHYFSRSSVKGLFEQEGFRVAKITSGGIFAEPRRIWASLLGPDIMVLGVKK